MTLDLTKFKAPEHFAPVAAILPEVRTPKGREDVRVYGEQRCAGMLMAKLNSTFFLIGPDIRDILGNVFVADLVLATSSIDGLFVWAVKVDNESAVKAAAEAAKGWKQISWHGGSKTYEVSPPSGKHPDPEWPEQSLDSIIASAFKGKMLNDREHPTVKKLIEKEEQAGR